MDTNNSFDQNYNSYYRELLRHPLWQKKRLEIFDRDNFTCRCCGNKHRELHCHHLEYKKGKLPHEYDDELLLTLCFVCHDEAHKSIKKITLLLAFQILAKKVDIIALSQKLDEL